MGASAQRWGGQINSNGGGSAKGQRRDEGAPSRHRAGSRTGTEARPGGDAVVLELVPEGGGAGGAANVLEVVRDGGAAGARGQRRLGKALPGGDGTGADGTADGASDGGGDLQ